MRSAAATSVLGQLLLCLLVATAAGQAPPIDPPVPTSPPGAAVPLPVPPDTAVVVLGWPPARPDTTIILEPDTLFLGDRCRLRIVTAEAVPDSLPLPPWLETTGPVERDAKAIHVPLRVYRLGPFRVVAGGVASPVAVVRGRLTTADAGVPVRPPRPPGWDLLKVSLLAALLGGGAGLAWWLFRRRWGGDVLGRHRRPAPAAWPRTAVALAQLLEAGLAPGGEREYLDRLTALVRAHVARRFLVPGRELTADEIQAACVGLGYERPAARPFVDLLAEVDRRRYDPRPLDEGYCLRQTARFLEAVAATRIEPLPGTLPAEEVAAGETAWSGLRARVAAIAVGGGGE